MWSNPTQSVGHNFRNVPVEHLLYFRIRKKLPQGKVLTGAKIFEKADKSENTFRLCRDLSLSNCLVYGRTIFGFELYDIIALSLATFKGVPPNVSCSSFFNNNLRPVK